MNAQRPHQADGGCAASGYAGFASNISSEQGRLACIAAAACEEFWAPAVVPGGDFVIK